MDRLTDKRFVGDGFYQTKSHEERLEIFTKVPHLKDIYNRLAEYEMGLRVGEISGLMGKDAKNGILTINRTIRRIPVRGQGTKLTISTPKTAESKRQIPIPDHIAYLFDNVPDDEYIIGGKKFVEPRMLMYKWRTFCDAQNIERINFHGLRHTFATKALEKGVDVKTLSEILGHASVDITMDLYCHPSMNHKAEAMKRIWGD